MPDGYDAHRHEHDRYDHVAEADNLVVESCAFLRDQVDEVLRGFRSNGLFEASDLDIDAQARAVEKAFLKAIMDHKAGRFPGPVRSYAQTRIDQVI